MNIELPKLTKIEKININNDEPMELNEIREIPKTNNNDISKIEGKPDIVYIENSSRASLLEKSSFEIQSLGTKELDETIQEGLSEDEKLKVKEEHPDWPDEIIDSIRSFEEYKIYDKANLKVEYINGKPCLIQEIDMNQKDADGLTNKERMGRGLPPITKDGKTIELHHIGQKTDSPLAELTMEEHRGAGNDTIMHDKTKESEINRGEFAKERREHWKERVNPQ